MPQQLPGHKYILGLAKQTAEGSAASTAEYKVPVYSADLQNQQSRTTLEIADGTSFSPGQYIDGSMWQGSVEWGAFPSSLPRIMAAHLGASCDTITGAADPWTHTLVRTDTPLWHTVWMGRPTSGGGVEYDQIVDALAKSFIVNYQNGQLVHVTTEFMAKNSNGVATAPTFTTTETMTAAGYGYTWLPAAASQLKLDLAVSPAVTTITNLQSFTLTCDYPNMAMEATNAVTPAFFNPGRWTLGFTATFIVQDWQAYNLTLYGSVTPAANTPLSAVVTSGSADFTLDVGPTANANRTFQITLPNLQFSLQPPTPAVDGSGITATLTGVLQAPAAGAPATFKIKNANSVAVG